MVRSFFRSLVLLLFAVGVVSCAVGRSNFQQQQAPLYDIRDVAVFAQQSIPVNLVAGVDRRVSDAIAATRRLQLVPRVVLTVRIDQIARMLGEGRDRHEARFTVDAVSVDTGMVIATGAFRAVAFSANPGMTDEILAEAIAGRIRQAFSLMTPSVAPAGYERFPPPPRARDYGPAPIEPAPQEPRSLPQPVPAAAFNPPADDEADFPAAPIPAARPKVEDGALAQKIVPQKETHAAGSDLESGAQGRITLKPALGTADAQTPCLGEDCSTQVQ